MFKNRFDAVGTLKPVEKIEAPPCGNENKKASAPIGVKQNTKRLVKVVIIGLLILAALYLA